MQKRYVAFLRGINVSGHHKVPMAQLKVELEKLGCTDVVTLLNSGNVIFTASQAKDWETVLSNEFENIFGFPIPTHVLTNDQFIELNKQHPFEEEQSSKDIKRNITLIKDKVTFPHPLPWQSDDEAFIIFKQHKQWIYSQINVSVGKTVDAMKILEKNYGKHITTRNWNTIQKMLGKL